MPPYKKLNHGCVNATSPQTSSPKFSDSANLGAVSPTLNEPPYVNLSKASDPPSSRRSPAYPPLVSRNSPTSVLARASKLAAKISPKSDQKLDGTNSLNQFKATSTPLKAPPKILRPTQPFACASSSLNTARNRFHTSLVSPTKPFENGLKQTSHATGKTTSFASSADDQTKVSTAKKSKRAHNKPIRLN